MLTRKHISVVILWKNLHPKIERRCSFYDPHQGSQAQVKSTIRPKLYFYFLASTRFS